MLIVAVGPSDVLLSAPNVIGCSAARFDEILIAEMPVVRESVAPIESANGSDQQAMANGSAAGFSVDIFGILDQLMRIGSAAAVFQDAKSSIVVCGRSFPMRDQGAAKDLDRGIQESIDAANEIIQTSAYDHFAGCMKEGKVAHFFSGTSATASKLTKKDGAA